MKSHCSYVGLSYLGVVGPLFQIFSFHTCLWDVLVIFGLGGGLYLAPVPLQFAFGPLGCFAGLRIKGRSSWCVSRPWAMDRKSLICKGVRCFLNQGGGRYQGQAVSPCVAQHGHCILSCLNSFLGRTLQELLCLVAEVCFSRQSIVIPVEGAAG